MPCRSYRWMAGAALLWASTAGAAGTEELTMTAAQIAALGVRLEAPQAAADAGTLHFPARVGLPAAAERAVVAPLPGTVETLLVGIGDTVRVGQPLATLFSAELGSLKASHVQLQAAERLARADRDRDAALLADGIIAARRMTETRSRHEVAAAQLAESSQRLTLAGAAAGDGAVSAVLSLRAAQAGVVLARSAGVGERVEAGGLLFRIASLERLLLEVQVPVEVAARLKIGDRLSVRNTQAAARISAIGVDAGGGTQSVQVRAELDAAGSVLRPGQVVEVEQRAAAVDGWSLPAAALVSDAAGARVYARSAGGFRAVPVTVNGRDEGRCIVSGGLRADDRVAVSAVIAIKAAFAGRGGGQ
ncbi:MAG: HlyD family secretion protein [Xanthomonadaceae bacterium]|nr:HlyD family secretion protein [Xanthomonadaceae bacterium]